MYKKKYIIVEIILEIKTKESAYQLYKNQKEYCNKYKIKISSKNTKMEYTKKIRFLVGPNIQLASPKGYIEELNDILSLLKGIMEIKKKYIYEKNIRSKDLMIYATISEANNVDKSLENIESERYLYVSFKRISSNNRLVAMHLNEMVNTKLRYETLFKAKLNNIVIKEKKLN